MKKNNFLKHIKFLTTLLTDRKVGKILGVFLLISCGLAAMAQAGEKEKKTIASDKSSLTPLLLKENTIPSNFKNVKPNVIVDSTKSLSPFFEKLKALSRTSEEQGDGVVVRIVQIGDSHVRSHEFTPGLSCRFSEEFGNEAASTTIDGYQSSGVVVETGLPGVVCHCFGIDGATCRKFTNEVFIDKICKLEPDLIILSFGTNEAMGFYKPEYHYQSIATLHSMLMEKCPNATFLYTTPPGCFQKKYTSARKKSQRRILSIDENLNVERAAKTIRTFAASNNAAYWDLFNIVGGARLALENWDKNNFFKRDKIHFTPEAYRFQGNLLYEALAKRYNGYIAE